MHLESVASCKASLQMKGGQKKEEVKGRKQSEKKHRQKKRGGERRGMAKELKRSNSARVKFKIGEKSHEVTAAGRGARARGFWLRFFPSLPVCLPRREKITPIFRFPSCALRRRGGGVDGDIFFSAGDT